jgi:hypothetical protein
LTNSATANRLNTQEQNLTSNHTTFAAVAVNFMAAAEKLWPEIEGAFRAVGRGANADTLKEGLRYRGAFYVLAGFAIENYAKALMARREELMTDSDILKVGRGQPLVRVAQDAEISLTAPEQALLVRLTQTMRWRGQFPIPVPQPTGVARTLAGTADMRHLRKVLAKFEEAYQRAATRV